MKQHRSLFLLLIFASICFGLGSCAKKQQPDTPATRIIGTWKKVKFATDDNNNGQIDSWEIFPVQAGTTNTLEFKQDNTGVEKASFTPDLDFNWKIVGDLSVMLSYRANDTVIYQLESINSNSMSLTTRNNISLAGYYYDKQ